MGAGAHDDVIQHFDVDRGQGLLQGSGEVAVGSRRAHVAAGMVVRQDDRCRPLFQRVLDHLPRVNRCLIQRAFEHFLKPQEAVLRIHADHGEHFMGGAAHLQLQKLFHRFSVEHLLPFHCQAKLFLPENSAKLFLRQFQFLFLSLKKPNAATESCGIV